MQTGSGSCWSWGCCEPRRKGMRVNAKCESHSFMSQGLRPGQDSSGPRHPDSTISLSQGL